ncbi:MAG TPA: O-antigen ligase family protein [Pseudolabrys sp.]|nr:O-antigen ligase family protein [Pseudolabrys sp.]
MITARNIARYAAAPMPAAALAPMATAAPFRERLLITTLFLTVLASSIAFIEPSPHDGLMGVLAIAGVIAGIRFHRILAVPLLLLLGWNFFGLMTLLNVPGQEKTVQYAVTSIYLALAALLFAMLFSENTVARLKAMRSAYILTAAFTAICGAIGYFHLFPGAEMFTLYDRALGTFKDPNVYAPFLILPALFLLEGMLTRRIELSGIFFSGIILFGLLLGFSRGSWFNFSVALAVVIALSLLTAPTPKARTRIIGLTLAGVAVIAILLAILLSIHSIGGMFEQRAQLIQNYDVGTGGRFRLQELAVTSVLNFPNGMGPFEFARVHGLQQHNVYLQAFLVYGWAGGLSYILLLVATLWVGFKYALVRTPWQGCAIAAVAAFFGLILEGFIIDTDHWRNFFLIMGIIWGLAAASRAAKRKAQMAPFPAC